MLVVDARRAMRAVTVSSKYVLVHHDGVEAETVVPTPPVPRKSRLDYDHLWQLSVAAQGSFGGYFVAIHIPNWDKTYKASWVTTGGPPAQPATSATTITTTSHRRTLSSIVPTSSSSPAPFSLPGLTQSEMDWALAFFIHPSKGAPHQRRQFCSISYHGQASVPILLQ